MIINKKVDDLELSWFIDLTFDSYNKYINASIDLFNKEEIAYYTEMVLENLIIKNHHFFNEMNKQDNKYVKFKNREKRLFSTKKDITFLYRDLFINLACNNVKRLKKMKTINHFKDHDQPRNDKYFSKSQNGQLYLDKKIESLSVNIKYDVSILEYSSYNSLFYIFIGYFYLEDIIYVEYDNSIIDKVKPNNNSSVKIEQEYYDINENIYRIKNEKDKELFETKCYIDEEIYLIIISTKEIMYVNAEEKGLFNLEKDNDNDWLMDEVTVWYKNY